MIAGAGARSRSRRKHNAIALGRPHDRDAFLQEVANALAGCSEIGPGTVAKACRTTQRKFFDPPALCHDVSKYR